MSKLKVILFVLLSVAVLTTCKKEHDRPQWDVGVLGPLVKGSLGINNLINDTLLKVNPDSTLTLVYNKNLYSLNIDSLFRIPDTTIVTPFHLFPHTFAPGSSFPGLPSQTNLAVSKVQLRYAIVKSGKAHIQATNKLHTRVYFTYNIPKATLNGIPFVAHASVDSATSIGPTVLDTLYDLSRYDLDLTGLSGNAVNSIEYSVQAYTDSFGPPVTVAFDTFLVIQNSFVGMVPYYAKGYLGQTTLKVGPDSTALALFKTIKSGTLDLQAATMKLSLEYDIGMDARLNISNIQSVNSNTNTSVDLIAPSLINNTININRASASGTNTSPSYIPTFYSWLINNSNSNFKSLLNNLPDYLSFALSLQTNPLGNVSGDNDFAFADHLVNANIDVEIPLNFSSNHLTLSDTTGFSLGSDSVLNNLGAGTLTFNVDNGFPFALSISLVAIDSQNHFVDMLLSSATVASPPLDTSFKVINKLHSQFIIPVDDARIEKLRNAKRMIVTASFTTAASPQHVKIYSDYSLDFKLIADIIYHVR